MIPLANAVTEVQAVAEPSATSLDVKVTVLDLESPLVDKAPILAGVKLTFPVTPFIPIS